MRNRVRRYLSPKVLVAVLALPNVVRVQSQLDQKRP